MLDDAFGAILQKVLVLNGIKLAISSVNPDKIKQLFENGLTKAAIAKQLNINRMSVYSSLQEPSLQ